MAADSHQQQEQPPFELGALPGVAVAAISDHVTTPSCPGPCRLAPVCKAWCHAAQPHLAGATVQLCLSGLQDNPAAPRPKGAFNKVFLDSQRTASIGAWLAKYGHLLAGFSLQFTRWPRLKGKLLEKEQSLRTAAAEQVTESLAAAAAVAAAAAAAVDAAGRASSQVACAAAAVGPSVAASPPPGLRLASLRLPLAQEPSPAPLLGLLSACHHLAALRLEAVHGTPMIPSHVVAALQHLHHLTALHLCGYRAAPEGWLDSLRLCSLPPSLEVLVLAGRDGVWALEGLGHLTRLRQLRLDGIVLEGRDGAGAAAAAAADIGAAAQQQQPLAGLTRLTALECETALGDSQALLQLPALVALGTLADAFSLEVLVGALQCLQGKPSLRRLTLAPPRSEEALVALGGLTQLVELTLGEHGFMARGAAASLRSAWREALGALTQLTRLQAPLVLLLDEEEMSDGPLVQLQQLHTVHVVISEPCRANVHVNCGLTLREYKSVQQVAEALVQVTQLKEVRIIGAHMALKEVLSVQAMVSDLLPQVAVTVTTQHRGYCSVVEEVLG